MVEESIWKKNMLMELDRFPKVHSSKKYFELILYGLFPQGAKYLRPPKFDVPKNDGFQNVYWISGVYNIFETTT